MQLLFGSQNFGYATEDSDRDFIRFTFPTWENMISGKVVEREESCATGIVKVKDIRTIKSMLNKPNFSSLQFMYSTEYDNCEDLDWFIKNRERLIRSNLYNLYKHNLPMIKQNADTIQPKNLTRAFVYTRLLERILHDQTEFKLYVTESKEYRENMECIAGKTTLMSYASEIKAEADLLEASFEVYKDNIDTEIIQAADNEIIRLLKKHLG